MKKIIALVLVLMMMIPFCTGFAVEQAKVEDVIPMLTGAQKLCEPGEVSFKVMAVVNSACDTWADQTVMKAYEQITGVHIDWVEVDGTDIMQTIRLTVMGWANDPDAADVILFNLPGTDMLQDYGENGTLMALEDLIKDNAPNAQAMLDNVAGLKSLVTAPDGHIYSLWKVWENPNESIMEKQFVFLPWMAKYNESIGKDAKAFPETLEEYTEMLRYFRDNDMNGNGKDDEIPLLGNNQTKEQGGCATSFIISAFQLWNCCDFFHVTDDKQVVFEANTDAYRDALKYMNGLYKEGILTAENFTLSLGDYRNTTNASTPEEIIVGVGAAPFYMRVITQSIYTRAYEDWEAIPPLKNYYDENVRQCLQKFDSLTSLMVCVNSKCENADILLKWLDYWYSEEGTMLNTLYGLKGRDWDWDNEAVNLGGTTPSVKVMQTLENSGNMDCPGHTGVPNYMTSEMFLKTAASKAGRTYPDYLAHMAYAPYAVARNIPTIAWCADYDLGTEFSDYKTNISAYIYTSLASFCMGEAGFDPNSDADWQNYLDTLNNLGLQRYLEIIPQYYGF